LKLICEIRSLSAEASRRYSTSVKIIVNLSGAGIDAAWTPRGSERDRHKKMQVGPCRLLRLHLAIPQPQAQAFHARLRLAAAVPERLGQLRSYACV
jgi:hypothetical protein